MNELFENSNSLKKKLGLITQLLLLFGLHEYRKGCDHIDVFKMFSS